MNRFSALLASTSLVLAAPAYAVPPALSPSPAVPTFNLPRAPVVVFAGDSIMNVFAYLGTQSPFYESLRKYPRAFSDWIDMSASGSYSGTVGAHTACVTIGGVCPDLNTAPNIARVIAAKPDILFVEIGGNDGGSVQTITDIYNNEKAFILAILASLPNCKIVVFTPPAQSFRAVTALVDLRARLYALSLAYPSNIYTVPLEIAGIDDKTSHAPVGGTTTSSIAVADSAGAHPSYVFAKAFEPVITSLFDQLNVPRINPYIASLNDRYVAGTSNTSCPTCNMWGGMGVMTGSTTSGVGSNVTGTTAVDSGGYSIGVSTDSAEMTAVSSTGASIAYANNNFTALQAVISAAAPITADRTFTFQRTGGVSTWPGGQMYSSIIVQATGVTGNGLKALEFITNCGINAVGSQADFGAAGTSLGANGELSDGTYVYVIPQKLACTAGGSLQFKLYAKYRSGTTPAGTIKIAQLVSFAIPTP